jgi:hypothetical protein
LETDDLCFFEQGLESDRLDPKREKGETNVNPIEKDLTSARKIVDNIDRKFSNICHIARKIFDLIEKLSRSLPTNQEISTWQNS